MSLKARLTYNRGGSVLLEHAANCPVESKTWADCNCGLFQGYDKPLAHNGNHKESCPCHCTCDFMEALAGKFVKCRPIQN